MFYVNGINTKMSIAKTFRNIDFIRIYCLSTIVTIIY